MRVAPARLAPRAERVECAALTTVRSLTVAVPTVGKLGGRVRAEGGAYFVAAASAEEAPL
jgi:hypothetical protein